MSTLKEQQLNNDFEFFNLKSPKQKKNKLISPIFGAICLVFGFFTFSSINSWHSTFETFLAKDKKLQLYENNIYTLLLKEKLNNDDILYISTNFSHLTNLALKDNNIVAKKYASSILLNLKKSLNESKISSTQYQEILSYYALTKKVNTSINQFDLNCFAPNLICHLTNKDTLKYSNQLNKSYNAVIHANEILIFNKSYDYLLKNKDEEKLNKTIKTLTDNYLLNFTITET